MRRNFKSKNSNRKKKKWSLKKKFELQPQPIFKMIHKISSIPTVKNFWSVIYKLSSLDNKQMTVRLKLIKRQTSSKKSKIKSIKQKLKKITNQSENSKIFNLNKIRLKSIKLGFLNLRKVRQTEQIIPKSSKSNF